MTTNGRESITVAAVEGIGRIPRQEWNSMVGEDDSPFLEWDWLNALEESGSANARTGWAPYHLVARRTSDRKMVAACPLYLKSHSMGEFVFDHGWADAAERAGLSYYPKLLVGIPFTPHTGRRIMTANDTDRRFVIELMGQALARLCVENKLSSVHVNFCSEDEAEALSRCGYLERAGYQYHWQNAQFGSFDDYLSRLKSKRRYQVRHERRAMDESGVEIRVLHGEQITPKLVPLMFEIYRSTVEKLYWGRQYLTQKFFELAAENFRDRICLVLAYQNKKPIAGTINLQKAGVFYGRYWGALKELRFLHFNVCYYAAIEHCIDRGFQRFEPGAGGEYKWLRGFDPALTRSMHFINHSGLRKAIESFVKRERREVETWIAAGTLRSQLKAPEANQDEPR